MGGSGLRRGEKRWQRRTFTQRNREEASLGQKLEFHFGHVELDKDLEDSQVRQLNMEIWRSDSSRILKFGLYRKCIKEEIKVTEILITQRQL